MTRYTLSLIRNKYILIYGDEANQMLRGTKKTSIGDAKLFEGGFGACILVGCFLSKIA